MIQRRKAPICLVEMEATLASYLFLITFHALLLSVAAGPSVIIVGAGFSGISAAKTLSDAGINNFVILEATNRIGGRICKVPFAGINVEKGANWVTGVNGDQINPIWTMAKSIGLRSFFSDYNGIPSNTYKEEGGLYGTAEIQALIDVSREVSVAGEKYSKTLPKSGRLDVSVATSQRLQNHVPSTAAEMVVDYYRNDYEIAEPPRVTSLQNTAPLPTFVNFGEVSYFVADQRGYESVVHHVAYQFLRSTRNGSIFDPRLILNKVVRRIEQSSSGVIVKTEDGAAYKADYAVVSVSLGVLQSKLIEFVPSLPEWKIVAIYQFDMAIYTKIFLKFPSSFWPTGNGTQFFLYASDRRGYYPIWQHFEREFPGSHVLMVIVTDDESRRIEQQPDSATKAEITEVLRAMFGGNVPDATDIFVPRWWSDRFYKGTFSNWPVGVNRFEFDQIRAPVERIYFTGEHTSEQYNGYVHGAYLSGIDSANILIKCIKTGFCKYNPKAKDGDE